MTRAFRCAAASLERDDALAGTASTVRAFLLVENPGPWGVDALRDSRMPEPARRALADASRETGVRVLLIRRHHARAPREDFRIVAAYADPVAPWAESAVLHTAADLARLDLAALGAGRSPGLEPHRDSLLLVCTHGRHDACCAERGRPVAAALAEAHPDRAWECSHIGGDRFAGNLLVLPDGLYYGRLDPASALAVAAGHRAGRLDLDHLRGRSGLAMPVQAAEVALRRQLAEDRLDAVRFEGARRDGEHTTARFRVAEAAYDVVVRSSLDERPARLTCHAERGSRIPLHQALRVERVG